MKTSAIKFCALYIRVSTADQGERYSLPSQLKALREKAAREGFTVREDFIFLDKHTGKVASRPDFDRLNSLVATGAVSAVFIFSVDRFARKTEDALRLAREYKRHGVRLDFVEMFYEDTPVGRFTFTQLAAFAELWGEKILADSARGRKEKLESGKLTHGSAKYGYIYVPKSVRDGARLELDPAMSSVDGITKQQVVKDVFRWRLEGTSMYGIAKRLNEAGILSAGSRSKKEGRSKAPGPWSQVTIRQMLRSRTYIGQHVCSGITVACPRIIDDETFFAVQKMNEENRRRLVGRPSRKYLLRSFLWCAKKHCGCRMITTPNHGYPTYRCGNIDYTPYTRRCKAPGGSVAMIENAAWNAIWGLLKDPALLLELGRAYYEAIGKPEGDSTGGLEHERDRLTAKVATTQAMVQDSLLPYAKGKADIRTCQERIRQIEEELRAAGRVVSLPPLRAAESALREITSGPEPTTYERRRNILEGIIDLRMNYYDGDLEILGKIPVPDAAGGKKNPYSREDSYIDSFSPIPFRIKTRVA